MGLKKFLDKTLGRPMDGDKVEYYGEVKENVTDMCYLLQQLNLQRHIIMTLMLQKCGKNIKHSKANVDILFHSTQLLLNQ